MDLHKLLESAEGSWNMEKMELLERFDSERKEWECQWKVMQRKIEELYQEVKLRRENNASEANLTDSPAAQRSKLNRANGSTEADSGLFVELEQEWHKSVTKRKNSALSIDHLLTGHCEKLEDCPDLKIPKKEHGALNEALKEIAKISDELSSYQEEIRKKSNHIRMKSYPVLGVSEETQFSSLRPNVNHTSIKNSHIPMDISLVEEQNNRKNLMVTTSTNCDNMSVTDRSLLQKSKAPPVPPRSTSWQMTSTFPVMSQAYNAQVRNLSCETPKYSSEQQYNSLHENQEMSLNDTTAIVTAYPAVKKDSHSECNAGFCHNKWTYELNRSGEDHKTGSTTLFVHTELADAPDKVTPSHCVECHSGLDCTNDSLGDSSYILEQTQRNGILAAKTVEFNRTVFQTNKVKTASEDRALPLTTPGNQNHDHNSLCGSSAKVEGTSNVCSVSSPTLSACRDLESCSPNKTAKLSKQQKQTNRFHSTSGYYHRLHEQDWKPSNLSGRPRSADSRSNYGVVEKLLKNYERSAVTSVCDPKYCNDEQIRVGSSFADSSSDPLSQCLEMLQIEQVAPEYQRNSAMSVDRKVKRQSEKQKLPEISMPLNFTNGRGFSRPARPTNRRLPSRWASRSPSAPATTRKTAHGYSRSLQSQLSVV